MCTMLVPDARLSTAHKNKQRRSYFICQFSPRVGTWTLRAWSLSATVRWGLFILIFLKKRNNKKQTLCNGCYAIKRLISEKLWMRTKRKFRFTGSLTCAVTTLSPLVALARSSECCSSLVRLLTVLLGDIRPGGSRASPLTKPTAETQKTTTYNFTS